MPRKNVGFVKPPEPSFITRMKQEAGYKEGPTLDTKREELAAATPGDLDDQGDDELPTVVVLRDGDLTAEQVAREMEQAGPAAKEAEEETSGRILFRKPVKRDSTGTPAAAGPAERPAGPEPKRSRDDKPKSKPKQNPKLLSFQNDDDEEED